ncbi:glycosyltransferase family 2 protein [Cognatiyoonia sediminum]|uniref:glycosyltransferase family 2 protein n=1 Tax=Cognatiyoonia sediminum TaxID=1508389 RepID=UPI0009321452|nr:glycosyltransferase family 2 protein [Cognatiyoonia sediminum]
MTRQATSSRDANEPTIRLDIGIFAYNESQSIGLLIESLGQQTIFGSMVEDIRVRILANGCTDDTVAVATKAIAALPAAIKDCFTVHDFELGGKSRTANRFIHELSDQGADILGFMDADIALPQNDTLERMLGALDEGPELMVFNSRPVKDVSFSKRSVGPIGKIIASGGGGLTDYRKSICGQLYFIKRTMADKISFPIGLPVEDGFMRAMVVTDLFSQEEDLSRLDGDFEIFHVYESITTIRALIKHQTRLIVGSSINAIIFEELNRVADSGQSISVFLKDISENEEWLQSFLSEQLPRWPYGYVPFRIGAKRIRMFRASEQRSMRTFFVLLAGIGLDLISTINANFVMWRGRGAGHW